jgi:AcrR family transcriptional regulator
MAAEAVLDLNSAAGAKPGDRLDNAKRRQILDGARAIFLAQGYDAASMGEIARAAGVSKGTLYVYFDSKETLFQAIVDEACFAQAKEMFALDSADPDVEGALTRLGRAYVRFLCQPARIPGLRAVIAISERMPEMGKKFYEAGPEAGIARLSHYLEAQNAAGILAVEDCRVAAAQFLDSCQSTSFKPLLFNFGTAPSDEQINHVVGIAVRTFMAAYRKR